LKHSQKHIALLLLLLPIVCLYSGAQNKKESAALGLKTVCIDAGHGGHDAGCISRDKIKTQEKDLALSIALSLQKKIKAAYPDVKVIMTRSDDRFIELGDRAAIANKGGADLFISIHINAANPKSPNYKQAKGFSIHTLGQSSNKNRDLFQANLELSKRENAVILLEEDYSTKYEGFNPDDPESFIFFNLMQNANLQQSLVFAEDVDKAMAGGPIRTNRGISQNPFLVLWKTTMPAVLIECGFITNESDLAILRTEKGRAGIAENIFQAFSTFKKRYDSSLNIKETPRAEPAPAPAPEVEKKAPAKEAASPAKPAVGKTSGKEPAAQQPAGVVYGTQVLASSRVMNASDKFFKGYQPRRVQVGKLYKYVIGTQESLEEARKEYARIRKLFPDSFMVKIAGDSVERIR